MEVGCFSAVRQRTPEPTGNEEGDGGIKFYSLRPLYTRIPLPLQLFGVVLAIQSDYPRRVDHFVHDYDVVLGLNELHVVIVFGGNHRRAGIKSHQATIIC